MDYLYIGSNGYAQVGEPDFHMKNKAEMAVLLDYLKTNFPIPSEFAGNCFYKIKWFQHDFGSYSEIVLMYDDQLVEQWEISDPERSERFWKWFIQVESANLESDALTEEIDSQYVKMTLNDNFIPAAHETQTR